MTYQISFWSNWNIKELRSIQSREVKQRIMKKQWVRNTLLTGQEQLLKWMHNFGATNKKISKPKARNEVLNGKVKGPKYQIGWNATQNQGYWYSTRPYCLAPALFVFLIYILQNHWNFRIYFQTSCVHVMFWHFFLVLFVHGKWFIHICEYVFAYI